MAWRRVSFRKRPDITITILAGIVFVLLGGVFVLLNWSYRAAVTSGVGGSLIAAAVVIWLGPFNDEAFSEFSELGIKRCYFYRTKVPDGQWCKWIREARVHCTLLGIAHHKWCEEGDFPDVVRESLHRGVQIKFLFLDPSSAVAAQRAVEDERAARNTTQAILDSIKFIWSIGRGLPEDERSNLKLFVYTATPSSGTNWFDNFMIVTHYLAGFPNVTSPALLVEPVPTEAGIRSLYDIYAENVRKVQERFSTEIDETWIMNHFPEEAEEP